LRALHNGLVFFARPPAARGGGGLAGGTYFTYRAGKSIHKQNQNPRRFIFGGGQGLNFLLHKMPYKYFDNLDKLQGYQNDA
jgi:hypothetical protein